MLGGCGGPRSLVPVPPPVDGDPAFCARLAAQLPRSLGARDRRSTTPVSDRTAAWGSPPVVLRCGVPEPPGVASGDAQPITVQGRVAWLRHVGGESVDWTAVDRPVFIEVAIPKRYAAADILVALTPAVAMLPRVARPAS